MARRYGAGSVYPLPNGRWAGQWSAGRDQAGNRVRGTVTADTEAAAWKALTLARKQSSSTRRRGGETVAEFLERWLHDVVAPQRRARTLSGYESIVTHHLIPSFGKRPVRSLTRREVQTWIGKQEGAPLSVRHRVECLRAAMSYAVRWGVIDVNPVTDLDLPTVQKRVVRAMRPEDARALLAAVEGQWFAPIVTVALYTGLRQGELLGLYWRDVDLRAGTLTVHGTLARIPKPGGGVRYELEPPKSDRSRRTVPLAPAAVEALREHQRAQLTGTGSWKGLVFAHPDRPIDGPRLTMEFQAALKAAGVARMRFHDLRHATASLLIAEGVPLAVVSSILGHSSIVVTVDVYGHLTDESKVAAVASMARAIG